MSGNELSFLSLIYQASPLVQFVMASLLIASIISWTLIFNRSKILKEAQKEVNEFEQHFWSGTNLNKLFTTLDEKPEDLKGNSAIFHAGLSEFYRLRDSSELSAMDLIEGARRSMKVAMNRELDELEQHLPFLATVGSVSPYIGLFGTVWGIMNAFKALGNVKQATLNLVAPGIAEALIATAIGLFAAIPAVVAYNKFTTSFQRLENRYDDFIEEFTNILQRQTHLKKIPDTAI
tara:strand:+ start:1678 stop:2379 length:702 start_codon:yes stop_codon:yes gene_type:complete